MHSDSNSLWTRNFIILLISNALFWMAFEMLTPTLPLFVEKLGGSPLQIGIITGIFTITALLIRPFNSRFSHIMDKKYLLLISICICFLVTGIYMFSTGLLFLLVIRLVHGFGFGVASTFSPTLASEELPFERLGEGMGYFGIGETICMSVGPLLGVAILNLFDFKGLFSAGAGVLLIATLIVIGIKRKPLAETPSQKEYHKKPIKFVEKRVLWQCLLTLILGIVFSGVFSFLPLFAKQQGISNVSWFFFISAIMGVVIRVVAGRIFDRKGPLPILIPSGFSLIIAVFLIIHSQTLLQLNIAAIFYGLGFSAVIPVIQAWTIQMAEADSREDAMSSFLNFLDLGFGGGSMLLGLVAQATSYKTMYLILIAFIIAYLALTLYIAKNKNIKLQKLAA